MVQHPFDPDRIMREAISKMTVERKLEVAHSLRELAWQIKAGQIRSLYPGHSDAELEAKVREVFLSALR